MVVDVKNFPPSPFLDLCKVSLPWLVMDTPINTMVYALNLLILNHIPS